MHLGSLAPAEGHRSMRDLCVCLRKFAEICRNLQKFAEIRRIKCEGGRASADRCSVALIAVYGSTASFGGLGFAGLVWAESGIELRSISGVAFGSDNPGRDSFRRRSNRDRQQLWAKLAAGESELGSALPVWTSMIQSMMHVGVLRISRGGRLLSAAALMTMITSGCNGGTGESEAGSEGSGVSLSTTATATATDSEGSASATEGTSASGASDSEGTGTGTATETGGVSATESGSSMTEGTATDTTTTGGAGFCGDDPPAGYFGEFDSECKNEPQVGTFNPVIEWHKGSFEMLPGAASASAPIVVQLSDDNMDGMINDDDMPDVVYIAYSGNNGVLRGISGDGTTELVNVNSVGLDRNKAIAGADIDGDGIVELIASTVSREIIVFEHDGTVKWKSASLTPHVGVYEVAVAISDMNGDGVPELIAGRAILDNEGNLLGAGTRGIGAAPHQNGSASMSFAVDLDDDGDQEVVVGNALYNIAGGDIWYNGEADGYPAVGDF
ncbi:MAG TPA: hypothetical protein ENJ18_01530, partial [Nannocystis exedens]|nr:hypothetical protein [Nannocystis exedens]